jgi:hypothetical protein
MKEGRCAFKLLTNKLTGKRSSERPRSRWEENIGMDLKKQMSIRGIGLIGLSIEIIGEHFINAALNFRLPNALEVVS